MNFEELYKDLFDNAHDLIHFAGIDSRLQYVNKSWERVLEFSEEEIRGQSIYSLLEDADKSRFIDYRENIIHGQPSGKQIIISIKSRSGDIKKLEGFVNVKRENGVAVYTTGIFRDITLKLQNEKKLRLYNQQLVEREENLKQLLVNAPDAVIVIDDEGLITFWNPKAEAIFGWQSIEVIGRSLSQTIVPPQHRQAHDNGMKRYLATGEAHVLNKTIEITALHKAGHEFYISLTISGTKQKGKQAFIAFIRDITSQKMTEFELQEKSRQLEMSNEQLESFAHVASHDMKEPIRKIKIFTGKLDDEFGQLLPEKASAYLHKTRIAAERLTQVVEGVLNYSTIRNIAEQREMIDLQVILQSICTDLEILITQKNAVIHFESLPPFEGVPFLIYQLFYNLINNALKFSKAGVPPMITIKAALQHADVREGDNENENKNQNYVSITVTDNGIGFNQEYATRIFETFARLNTKDKYEGSGLGLAICKNIVERHNGFISASGNEEEGAVFTILLPGTGC